MTDEARPKKSKRKLLVKIATVLAVVVLVAVLAVMILIDSAAKATITHGGSYATMVDTSVKKADVGLFSGRFDMRDFRIGNPEGYDKTPYFMAMDDMGIDLDSGSVFSDTVEIPELKINGIDLYLDKTGSPGNYNQILENLKRFESGEAPEGEKPESAEGGKKVVIKLVEINDVTVHVAGIPGIQQLAGDVAIKVDQIRLTDVGKDGGVSIPQLFGVLIKAVISAAINAGGSILPDDVLGELGDGLAGLGSLAEMGITEAWDLGGDVLEGAGEVLEGAGDLAGDAAEGVGDAAGDVVEGIGNLFGGGDDEDDGG